MTVGELIKELEAHNPAMIVLVEGTRGLMPVWLEVQSVARNGCTEVIVSHRSNDDDSDESTTRPR